MRRQWQVRRVLQPHPDGQRRWDRAYTRLLAPVSAGPDAPGAAPAGAGEPPREEAGHEGRDLCARVHPQRQAQADGLGQQLDRLGARARQEGWTVGEDDLFRDDGFSGAGLKRPGLERLRDRAAAHALDVVLITAPDRLARNHVHQVLRLEELAAAGCRAEFLDRPMSEDPHDQLLLQIRGAVAEYERGLITERMRRGRQRKLRAGLLLPWSRPPFGYRVDPDRPRDPAGVRRDEAEAAVVAEMFAWYAEEGRSLYGLAQKLGRDAVPTPTGLRRWNLASLHVILTNPVYTGQVYSGRVRRRAGGAPAASPGAVPASRVVLPREDWTAVASVPAVVDEAMFDRVQARLSQNQQFAARNNTAHPYLLRGLDGCGRCGLACTGRHLRPGYRYYCCRGKLPAVHSCRDTKCLARYAPAETLEAAVWDDLCAPAADRAGDDPLGVGAGARRPLAAAGAAGAP